MKIKKGLAIILILALLLMSFGCSKPSNEPTTATTTAQQTEAPPTETTTEAETTQTTESNLEGDALLSSITYTMPDSFVMETQVTMGETTSMMRTYSRGQSQRIETEGYEGMNGITIYNAEEGMTYMYTEGETFGLMSSDENLEDEDEGMASFDWEQATLKDMLVDMPVLNAQRVMLDGKEAIYIEIGDTYEGVSQISKFWYSSEYPILYKYQIEENGNIVMMGETTRFEVNIPLDDALFEKPKDVEFQDFYSGFDSNYELETETSN